jgi:hypothetical protein
MLIFASESGTILPSKNACFERSTTTPPNKEWEDFAVGLYLIDIALTS